MDRREALGQLLDLAYDDQAHYLSLGDPEKDYAREWLETARNKAVFYQECAKIEQELGSKTWPNRWTVLSNELLIRAFGTENTEKQQKTDGEGNGDNPSTAPPRFDLGK